MERISPEAYRKILQQLELKNITLTELKTSIKKENFQEDIVIDISDSFDFENIENGLIAKVGYKLSAKNKARKKYLKIESLFEVKYASSEEIDEEFFEIFKDLSLPMNVWPYFRELVNSITSRMGIPPLTIPLLKI